MTEYARSPLERLHWVGQVQGHPEILFQKM